MSDQKISLSDYLKKLEPALTWLLLTETIHEVNGKLIRDYAHKNNISLAAIFYDAIPIIQPDLCKDKIIFENHAHYMRGLSYCNLIVPISEFSKCCLENFWKQEGLAGGDVKTNLLPGEFSSSSRSERSKDFFI